MTKLFIALLPLVCISCSENVEIKHNYHEIRDHLVNWQDIFTIEDDSYLIYFYSERCGHCNDIKQDIISFYFKKTVSMYFVCTDYYIEVGPTKDLIGINTLEDFYIFGTPFLVEFINNTVSSYYVGSNEILDYISILK